MPGLKGRKGKAPDETAAGAVLLFLIRSMTAVPTTSGFH